MRNRRKVWANNDKNNPTVALIARLHRQWTVRPILGSSSKDSGQPVVPCNFSSSLEFQHNYRNTPTKWGCSIIGPLERQNPLTAVFYFTLCCYHLSPSAAPRFHWRSIITSVTISADKYHCHQSNAIYVSVVFLDPLWPAKDVTKGPKQFHISSEAEGIHAAL